MIDEKSKLESEIRDLKLVKKENRAEIEIKNKKI